MYKNEGASMDYNTIVKQVADKEMLYICEHGYARAGVNGPYHNEDTAVRNSAHWITTYSYLYSITGNRQYYETAKTLSEFLLKEENYGSSGSICARTDARFDHTNGLIGQAWVIEGLIAAAELFDSNLYYEKALNLFGVQHFNPYNNLWEVTDCDGTKDFDLTFNHQLWFAASGAMILEYEAKNKINTSAWIDDQIKCFLSASEKEYFNVKENGCIVHVVNYKKTSSETEYSVELQKKRKNKSFKTRPMDVIRKKITDKLSSFSFTEGLEEGYHIFDLYGFALLKNSYGEHPLFKSDKLRRALSYALDTDKLLELRNSCGGSPFNKFAFGYNSPAFEYPFVAYSFRQEINQDLEDELFQFQIDNTYAENEFSQNCEDPNTLGARVYELVRYLRKHESKFQNKKRHKICFLTNNIAEMGGRQRVNALLANEFAKTEDLDVSIVFTSNYKTAMKQFYALNSRVRVLWDRRLCSSKKDIPYKIVRYFNKKVFEIKNAGFQQFIYFPAHEVRALNRFFRSNEFDTIIGVGTRAGAMLSLVNNNSKKIVWLHTSYDVYFLKKNYFQWHQEALYKKLLSRLDEMVVLTDGDVARYKKNIECNPVRIYNPLTLSCDKKATLEENELIFVGRLDYDIKGLDLLVNIMLLVKKEIPDIHLTVVGDGSGRKQLEDAITEAGILQCVTLAGETNDVESYYRKASIALLTSRKEGFGLVATEAMECGLPVVSFKTEGPSEIIIDGENGFLVDQFDVDTFAEKIILLCKNKKLRWSMGRNAMQRAGDFSIKVIIDEWRSLFASL